MLRVAGSAVHGLCDELRIQAQLRRRLLPERAYCRCVVVGKRGPVEIDLQRADGPRDGLADRAGSLRPVRYLQPSADGRRESVHQAVPHDRRAHAVAARGVAGPSRADPLPPRARVH